MSMAMAGSAADGPGAASSGRDWASYAVSLRLRAILTQAALQSTGRRRNIICKQCSVARNQRHRPGVPREAGLKFLSLIASPGPMATPGCHRNDGQAAA